MDALSIVSIGMQDDLQRMSSISQNLANVTTPAYKREIAVTRSFDSHMEQARAVDGRAALPQQQTNTVALDMSHGALRYTGNALDLAIEGDGYFEVMTDKGPAYTRRGMLHLDTRGRIVTEQGNPLMGVGGELVVSGTSVTVDRNGEVRQSDRLVGQVKLVRFANPNGLVALDNGLFAQGTARLADTGIDGAIRAGYQEGSNVSSPQEMVRLTETVRHFEAMQKIMQVYDDAFEKTLQKLGDF